MGGRRPALAAFLLLLTTAATAAPAVHPDPSRTLVAVVGAKTKVQDLSSHGLRRLFLGETVFDAAGRRLLPLNWSAGTPERIAFDRKLLGFSPAESGRYWIDRKIRGEGQPPRAFAGAATIRRLVASVPGAVAYLRADQLDASVAALKLDGLKWDEVGYALRLAAGELP